MTINSKDAVAGVLFILLGVGFGVNAYLTLPLGTNVRMGPGYFPLLLSVLLAILGATILVRALRIPDESWGDIPWRGLFFVLLGPIAFGSTIQGLGLVPALTLVVLLTSFASQRMSVLLAIPVTVGLVLFCVAVFSWGLGSPIQLFGPWLQAVGLGN